MSNLQVEANQSTNNIPITLTPKQQPTLLLTPDKVWGTKDYKDLENKPSLNGRELTKGMTLADFNLHPDKVEKNEEDIININEYLKELTPKNTAEGESSLYIKDALELPIFEMSIEGNSHQQQTTGKQLYNYKDTTQVTDGITVDENGWITVTYDNSAGTSTIYSNYWTKNLNLKANTNYNVIVEVKSVSVKAGDPSMNAVSYNGTAEGQFSNGMGYTLASLSNGVIKQLIRPTKESLDNVSNGLRSFATFPAGSSGSITFRLSVLEDTNITPETFVYEKYTGENPSPNPNYPQEVEVIDKDFEVKSSGLNLIGLPDIEETISNDLTYSITNGLLKINGTAKYLTKLRTLLFNIPKETGKYRLEIFPVSGSWSKGAIGVRGFNNGLQKWYSQTLYQSLVERKEIQAEQIKNNTDCDLYVVQGSTFENFCCYVQFKKGNEYTDYAPYQESVAPINLPDGEFIGKISENVKDTLKFKYNEEDGNYHLVLNKMLGKAILNGGENYTLVQTAKGFRFHTVIKNLKNNEGVDRIPVIMSSHFNVITPNGTWTGIIGISSNTANSVLLISMGEGNAITTVDGFKQ